MKIILNHDLPFSFAHGGVTNIVRRTWQTLEKLGFEVEPLRWWDDQQTADILFQFCRPSNLLVDYARSRGLKVVVEQVLTGLVSRAPWKRRIETVAIYQLRRLPSMVSEPFGWRAFETVDMHFVPSRHDARVIREVFGVPQEKISILEYGVDDEFLCCKRPTQRGDRLICTATITERKQVLELATASYAAEVPLDIVGKPYSPSDPYFLTFNKVVTQSRGLIRHIPHVNSRTTLAEMLASSRGFVLLSTMETVSQSALEAAACGCPLLLPDLEWARGAFGDHSTYAPRSTAPFRLAPTLADFYRHAANKTQNFPSGSWLEKRKHLKSTLSSLL